VRVLVLGGTGEGRALAARLADRPELHVVSSLAGAVATPVLPPGRTRVGGFGGVEGLTEYLRRERVDRVVDATHPFATRITGHAVAACAAVGVPLLLLRRPDWTAGPGDRWRPVRSVTEAAAAVAAEPAGTVLLTVGRRAVAEFADDAGHDYVVRSVDPPTGPLPARLTLLPGRGPFSLEAERELLRRHAVRLVVTRHSGGPPAPKLAAAREAGLSVVLIERPAPPAGVDRVTSVGAALGWIAGPAAGTGGRGDTGAVRSDPRPAPIPFGGIRPCHPT
jgi:precorrin-6A/cobalt-precorrin-6A reductase